MTSVEHEADTVMTVTAVANELNVIDETILRLLRAGDLRGFKVGAAWRIYRSDLEEYILTHANWQR